MSDSSETLSNLLREERHFDPAPDFAANANVTGEAYAKAGSDRLAFWETQAARLDWATPPETTLQWDPPFAKWFDGGTLNASVNCVDRHVAAGHGDQVAINFEGEPGDTRTITYAQLLEDVCRAANAISGLGVEKGDRVAIYLPMIPEAVVAMLACARIGAPHSVVFGGFSSQALFDRIVDAEAKLVITADGGYRRGAAAPLKPAVDDALAKGDTAVQHVLVVERTGGEVDWTNDRDVWWHDALADADATARGRAARRRAPALHPLHVRNYWETKGDPPHDRRLPHPGQLHPPRGVRPQTRHRRVLVRG